MVDLPGPTSVRGIGAPRPRSIFVSGVSSEAVKDKPGKGELQTVRLAKDLASEPAPLDHAKVARIRAALQDGTYSIDPHKIARAVLGNG